MHVMNDHNFSVMDTFDLGFLPGHKGVVNDVSWSHDNRWLLTCSEDRTAAVWGLTASDPVMTLTLKHNNFGADKEDGLKPTAVV